MNNLHAYLGRLATSFLFVGLVVLTASLASGAEKDSLRVFVDVPTAWDAFLEDDISDAFADRVREVFDRRGFKGDIEHVESYTAPENAGYLLSIHLIEWRVDRIGNVQCTFTANLQTPKTIRQFGVYADTAPHWVHGGGRWGLSKSFDEAAEGAIQELYKSIAKTELVPGLRSKS